MLSLITYFSVFGISSIMIANKKNKKIFVLLGIITLIMFAAGRYHVGTDMQTYTNIFVRYSDMSWQNFFANIDSEFLFGGIAKLTFESGGRVLTWGVFAALIVIPTYLALKNDYKDLYIGVAFFIFCISFYATSFNVTRQFIAVALVFWGIRFVYQNRIISFILTIVVATGFHSSALVAILIWLLWDHKNNQALRGSKRLIFFILIAMAVFGFQEIIIFLSKHISLLSSYSGYAETSLRGQNRDLYVSIFELVFIFLLERKQIKFNDKMSFMFSLMIIATLIGFTGFLHPQVKRNAYYFIMPARLVLWGYLPYRFKTNSRKIAKGLICIYFMALFVFTSYILGDGNLIPYNFNLFSPW